MKFVLSPGARGASNQSSVSVEVPGDDLTCSEAVEACFSLLLAHGYPPQCVAEGFEEKGREIREAWWPEEKERLLK